MTPQRFKDEILPCYKRMFATAHAILRNSDDAADAVQESITGLWNNRDRLDGVANIGAFCNASVRNVSINMLLSRRASEPLADSAVPAIAPPADAPFDLPVIMRLIDTLPPGQKRALTLSAFAGCSNSEIERITGESATNVRQLLSRARRTLRLLYSKSNI